jgi:hypothetical protein
MKRFLGFLVALTLSTTVSAEQPGGRFQSLLGFSLNGATLADITHRYGEAAEFELPEGHHESAVCYSVGNSGQIVLFSTDGEFGGPEKELLGISIRSSNTEHFPCSPLAVSPEQLVMDKLSLGISEKQFRVIVGEPAEQTGPNTLSRAFEWERTLSIEETEKMAKVFPGIRQRPVADVSHSVWGVFKEGRLAEFGCWRMETY